MSKGDKALWRLISGTSDRNFRFDELRSILTRQGFSFRVKGDHFIFTHPAVAEIINIQPDGALAKPYQVKQVRSILISYGFGAEDGDV